MKGPAESLIDDFLEGEIGDSERLLDLITERTRNPGPDSWGFSGDSCGVSIGPEDVHVENEFTGRHVTLPRAGFLQILEAYADAVRPAARPDQVGSRPWRSGPSGRS
jgi:hypothetical protein